MEKRLILRGLLAGAVGGLLAFLFARIFAEPLIQQAIDYESGRAAAQAALDKAAGVPVEPADAEVFSRVVQADVGLGVGVILFGMAMGALFAVAYCICLGRVGRLRARPLAMLVAAGGFLGTYLVPFFVYLVTVTLAVGFLILAVLLGRRLRDRFGNWNASLLAGAAFVVAIGVVMALLPPAGHLAGHTGALTETPQPLRDPSGTIVYPGFPADVLFGFRLYSIGAQLVMWTAIGLVFGPLAVRLLDRAPAGALRPVETVAG
jgi:hypothetical protein